MAKGKKTGGRTKGAINKVTLEQKKRIEFVLSILDESLEGDLKKIPELERVKLWASLQEFVRPKLARTEHTGEDGGPINLTIQDKVSFSIKSKGK